MHISWSFLDKHHATVEAIKAFKSMDSIIKNTPDEIQNVRNSMGGVASPKLDGLPSVHNPQVREDRLLSGIDAIDVLEEKYRNAVEYMDWFKPAWEQLSDNERYVLDLSFMENVDKPMDKIANHFRSERTAAYARRKRAINHLRLLLYGK